MNLLRVGQKRTKLVHVLCSKIFICIQDIRIITKVVEVKLVGGDLKIINI